MKHLLLEQIFEYIDNTAQPSEAKRIEVHLRECATCRAEVDFHKECTETLERSPIFEPSHQFSLKLMNTVLTEPLPKANLKLSNLEIFRLKWFVAASIIISLGILISSIPQHQSAESKPSEVHSIIHSYSDWLVTSGHSITNFFMTLASFLPIKSLSSLILLLCSVALLWIADKLLKKRVLRIH